MVGGWHMAGFGESRVVRQGARYLVYQPVDFDLGDALGAVVAQPRYRGGEGLRLAMRRGVHGGGLVLLQLAKALPQPGGAAAGAFQQQFGWRPVASGVARRSGPEVRCLGICADVRHRGLPSGAADAGRRRHCFRQLRPRAPLQRVHRVNEKLQQAVRVQRFPHQR